MLHGSLAFPLSIDSLPMTRARVAQLLALATTAAPPARRLARAGPTFFHSETFATRGRVAGRRRPGVGPSFARCPTRRDVAASVAVHLARVVGAAISVRRSGVVRRAADRHCRRLVVPRVFRRAARALATFRSLPRSLGRESPR